MNKKFTKFFMLMFLALSPMVFFGQNNEENKTTSFNDYAYISGDLGLGFLNGDNSGLKLGLNGHLGIGYQFDYILGINANFGYGGLDGEYTNRVIDKSNYFEGNLNLTIDVTNIILGYNPDRKLSLVPHIGIGQVHFKTRVLNNDGALVTEKGFSERYGRKVIATIPMGVEINYAINPSWKLHLDYTANYADTDLLDGIARGEHNDWFTTLSLGASYRLGSEANIFRRDDPYCNYWYLMADGGASFIFGDNQYNFKSIRGNANVGIGYDFHNFYRIYAKLGYGIFTGEYENFFKLDYADYYEANINVAAEIVGFIFGYDQDRRYGIYPHIGLGQMQYRARATYANGKKTSVGYDHDASYNKKGRGFYNRKVVMTVPVGLEFNYIVSPKVDVYADVTTKYADSDIVDAIWSGKHNDWHTTMNVGMRYKLNNSCFAIEEEDIYHITPEDVKRVVKEALAEQEANQPKVVETKTEIVEKQVIYHTNHANIVFPINETKKIKCQTNIDAINRASQELQKGFQVEEIIVEGYASPEGPADENYRLAEERAKAAAELVQEELHVHLDESHVTIHSNGADWDGLIEAILGSDLKDSETIANKIKESSNREETLRQLMCKYPQIEMLLPQLRRANVTITTVK